MMTCLHLSQMTHEDVPELYRVYLYAPLQMYSRRIFQPSWLHAVVDDPGQHAYSVRWESSRRLIGGATLWPRPLEGQWSPTIWLHPTVQGQGVGRNTLQALWNLHEPRMQKMVGEVYAFNGRSVQLARRFFGDHTSVKNIGEWDTQLVFEKTQSVVGIPE
jgi:RimJ/RimL family protein N-acetyltransferase